MKHTPSGNLSAATTLKRATDEHASSTQRSTRLLSWVQRNFRSSRRGLAWPKAVTLAVLGIPILVGNSQASEPASASATSWPQKPAWLTDLSLGLKESFDDNVFLSGADQRFLPAGYVVPPGSVAALQHRRSWVTTVAPKMGFNFAPLLGVPGLDALSVGYAPDFSVYHDLPSESNDAHRFATAIKGKMETFSYNLENSFNYIHGSDVAPFYPGNFLSAFGVGAPRERREQIQDRSKIAFRFDQEKWFVRPTASLLYYDLMTDQRNIVGYQNFPDRYDVNGGADLGYKIMPDLAVTAGYRYGHQYQEQFSFSPYSASSDYHRVLLGLEGRPWKWLRFELQGGPDFRHYEPNTPSHITPMDDKNPVKYYGEATLTSELTAQDTLIFKYRQFQWVSSVGKVPYFDSLFDLTYRRILMEGLTLDLGGRMVSADYNGGNTAGALRTDLQYTVSAGVTYAFNKHLSANVAYSLDLGRNAQDDLSDPQTREYNRHLVSLGALVKF